MYFFFVCLRNFLRELSATYELCKLGVSIPLFSNPNAVNLSNLNVVDGSIVLVPWKEGDLPSYADECDKLGI